ncbi:autotransporter domain-containing protein [uncultured Ruegeria sp.]|uniref:autotransporter family protein n=1 Tax=uncultured Ruegeria sp. TaxID=259304 RepID=UPI0026395407|nr:autotransporter domain-containing protein [uncultured Ruegeria sp.]
MSDFKSMNCQARRKSIALKRKKNSRTLTEAKSTEGYLLKAGAFGVTALLGLPHGALAQTVVPPSNGPCVVDGTTVTCTGDVSSGIEVNGATINTLIIEDVDAPGIVAGPVVDGINFTTTADSLNIRSTSDIVAEEFGIFADLNGDGNVTIDTAGDITSLEEDAIDLETTNGNINLTVDGNITSLEGHAIDANVVNDGDINIVVTGDITTLPDGSEAIEADVNGDGNITVIFEGNINSDNDGIELEIDGDGDIRIVSRGNIFAETDDGLEGDVDGDGDITIISIGSVDAANGGIEAQVEGDGNITIETTGSVTGRGNDGVQTDIDGDGTISITTNGTVFGDDFGIVAEVNGDGSIDIVNTADVTSVRSAAIGVIGRAGVSPATITNSGTLTGGNGFAIDLQDEGNDVVNLLPGSRLNGAADFGNNNPNDVDTLNFARGLNTSVNFADASGDDSDLASAPEIINFGGAGVLINNGLTAVAVDTSGFAAQGTVISDLTDVIFNTIETADPVPAAQENQVSQGYGALDRFGVESGSQVWVSGVGGYREVTADGSNVGYDHRFYGLISGIESSEIIDAGTVGFLAGYSDSRVSLDENAGETDVTSYFGGAYWKRDFNGFSLNAAFVAGVTDNDTTRNVDGQQAEGEFDGTFYAPSIAVAVPINNWANPAYFSARANYVLLQLDEYTETGVDLPLTVEDRDVSLFNTRAQLNFPQTITRSNGGVLDLNWTMGIDATFDAGSDDIDAIVAATPFSFVANAEDTVAGFFGLDLGYSSADGLRTVGFNGEFQPTFDGGFGAVAELRAIFRF